MTSLSTLWLLFVLQMDILTAETFTASVLCDSSRCSNAEVTLSDGVNSVSVAGTLTENTWTVISMAHSQMTDPTSVTIANNRGLFGPIWTIASVFVESADRRWAWGSSDVRVSNDITDDLNLIVYATLYTVQLQLGDVPDGRGWLEIVLTNTTSQETFLLLWPPNENTFVDNQLVEARLYANLDNADSFLLRSHKSLETEITSIRLGQGGVDRANPDPSPQLSHTIYYGCADQPAYAACASPPSVDAKNPIREISGSFYDACDAFPCGEPAICAIVAGGDGSVLVQASRECGCTPGFTSLPPSLCVRTGVEMMSLVSFAGMDLVVNNDSSSTVVVLDNASEPALSLSLRLQVSGPVDVAWIEFSLYDSIGVLVCLPSPSSPVAWTDLATGWYHGLVCTLPAPGNAIGAGWQPSQVRFCAQGTCISLPAIDATDDQFGVFPHAEASWVSYPRPVISNTTLRFEGGVHEAPLLAKNAVAELVQFDGKFLIGTEMPHLTEVFYGPMSNPLEVPCELQPSTPQTITCLTSEQKGESMMFTIVIRGAPVGEHGPLAQLVTGSDVYSIPVFPTITAVSVQSGLGGGCVGVGSGLEGCPTNGGVKLTVDGTSFLSDTLVFVDGNTAGDVRVQSSQRLTCLLPPGGGRSGGVVVSSSSLLGRNQSITISYAPPNITSLWSDNCVQGASAVELEGCLHDGGELTIRGRDFYGQNLVFVGQSPCLGLHTPDGKDSYSTLVCQFQKGMGRDQAVLVITEGQVSSGALLSFALCPPGTYVDGLICRECGPGSYAPTYGQFSCVLCPLGRISEARASVCGPCAKGDYGSRIEGVSPPSPSSSAVALPLSICTPCPAGSFAPFAGASTCSQCEEGTVAFNDGNFRCEACIPGRFATANMTTQPCAMCPSGTFSRLAGSSECTVCPPGRATPGQDRFQCDACPPGKYQPGNSPEKCLPCAVGTFSLAGEAVCQFCAAGSYSAEGDNNTCIPCPGGTHQPGLQIEAPTNCTYCPPGRFSGEGQRECTRCGVGLVAPFEGATTCEPCPLKSLLLEGGQSCVCEIGYFLRASTNPKDSRGECVRCPEGATCDSVGVTALFARPGWWHSSDDSEVFYPCHVRSHCPPGRIKPDETLLCPPSRTGPVCALCRPGYSAISSNSATCDVCRGRTVNLALAISISVALVIGVVVLFYLVLRNDPEPKSQVEKVSVSSQGVVTGALPTFNPALSPSFQPDNQVGNKFSDGTPPPEEPIVTRSASWSIASAQGAARVSTLGVVNFAEHADLGADGLEELKRARSVGEKAFKWTYTLKILIGFMQCASSVAAMEFRFPLHYQIFLSYFSFVSLNFLPWSAMDCLAPFDVYSKTLILCGVPLVLFGLVYVLLILPLALCQRADMSDAQSMQQRVRRMRSQVVRAALLFLFLIYPSVSQTVLQLFICREIDGELYIVADFSRLCQDADWFQFLPWAIGFILLYPVGILAFFFTLLWKTARARSDLRVWGDRNERAKVLRATETLTGFLWHAYNRGTWWFEILDMCYKLTLVSVVRFFPLILQLPLSMGCVLVYIVVVLVQTPYANAKNNMLSLLLQVELLLLLQVGWVRLEETSFDDESVESLLLSILLIALAVCAFITFVLTVLRHTRMAIMARLRCCRRWRRNRRVKKRGGDPSNLSAGLSYSFSDGGPPPDVQEHYVQRMQQETPSPSRAPHGLNGCPPLDLNGLSHAQQDASVARPLSPQRPLAPPPRLPTHLPPKLPSTLPRLHAPPPPRSR